MRSFVTYTLLASTSVVAAISPRFEFPDTVPALEKRQEPGTPRYQCHEDCGLLITLGREEGYCDNDEWNERYGRCMICANTFEIWQYYRNGVTSAASECDLSPTPSPSGFTPSSTAAEEPATTEAEEPATTANDDDEATTGAAEEPATTAAEETTADDSTPGATTTADGSAPEETDAEETGAEETDAEETDGSAEETTGASATADPTTFSTTQSGAVTGAPNPTETEAGSAGTRTSADQIGTIGVTTTPVPSSVIVNGAAKQFGFSTAIAVAALAMLGLY